MNNNIKIKLSKTLTNNYILLLLVSYIYLIIKINNNSFKELLTYMISVLLFYIYFKNLKKSYIFGFFVLLIRFTFKRLFNNIENFKDNKDNNERENIIKDMDNQAARTKYKLTTKPIKTNIVPKDIKKKETKEDITKRDNYVKSTENGVKKNVHNAKLSIKI